VGTTEPQDEVPWPNQVTAGLGSLSDSFLPLNRKERYFTGTVFPMIVWGVDGHDLHLLGSLLPNCELPPINTAAETTNVQFFTEYSLVESIFGPVTARFPEPPMTKDTPDIMILVAGAPSLLIALEAKMYHQPSAGDLARQMKAQRQQLEYLTGMLSLETVRHAALLPQKYADRLREELGHDPDYPIVLWEDLLETYRPHRSQGDYFMSMLELALERWDDLASLPAQFRLNAELLLTGTDVRKRHPDPALKTMGRAGGIEGPTLAKDITSGSWRTQLYEMSSSPTPANRNWFAVSEFVERIKEHGQA